MKKPLLIGALCLVLVAWVSGCGGDDTTRPETQNSATSADGEAGAKPDDGPLEAKATKVVIGDYEAKGPFSAVSGQKGNERPRLIPSGRPVSDETLIRDLEEGSGPAAQRGDEVSFYYAGSDHATGDPRYEGWPPNLPATIRLGFGTFGRSWEKTIEGMKVGGIRQVIITASYLSRKPLDYVIVLTALRPQKGA